MSMEYLTYPWMDYFFKDSADQYRKTHLEEGLRVIPYMACVDEFQHEVYAQKMTDTDKRYQLWHALEEKYMPWRDYDGDPFLEAGGFWCRNSIFLCVRFIILTIRLHLWEHLSIISVLLMTERQHGRTISDFVL